MSDNYNILISKLDEFIRKYYKNRLIRGGLYCMAIVILFYIIINILEYYAHFNTTVRTILFYSFIFINAFIVWKFILISLFKLYKIGELISNEYAAEIIGKHFPEIKDKLLNTLQLMQLSDVNPENKILIEASIDQRIINLKPIPFSSAIDLKQNVKYLKYALPPALLLLILLIAAPSIITESTKRLVRHNIYFEKPLPYQFIIQNEKLEAVQQEDFRIDVKIKGNEVPNEVFIKVDNSQFKLDKDNVASFHYIFKNVQRDIHFNFLTDEVSSKPYEIKVLPKPIILNFDVELNYPAYINKKNEILENTGDLMIPAGTKVKWRFFTKDTRNVILKYKNASHKLELQSSNGFIYSDIFKESLPYSISTKNDFLTNKDSLFYLINVIPDAYPTIDVEEYKDSIFQKNIYFKGMIKDDYGFNRLTFNFSKINSENKKDSSINKTVYNVVPITKTLNPQQFYYHFDLSTLSINPGDEIEYYFEVWDNDGVNGPKSSRSQKALFKVPSN